MKKAIIGTTGLAAVSTTVIIAVRRFGPDLAQRGMRKCHEMMARMTEQSKPSVQLTGNCPEGDDAASREAEQKPQVWAAS